MASNDVCTPLIIYQVDAFTNQAFKGNPASVAVLPQNATPSDKWMQNVAMEFNNSETAFVQPTAGGRFRIRWFTPTDEVDLCGHATLASAHTLWETGRVPADTAIELESNSGLLRATPQVIDDRRFIQLDFPSTPPAPLEGKDLENGIEIVKALNLQMVDPAGDRAGVIFSGRSKFDYFFVLSSVQLLRELKPNFHKLAKVETRGFILSARAETSADAPYDYFCRALFPGLGVNEDPVCGSAHCALVPYWEEVLDRKGEMLRDYEISARGGELYCRTEKDRTLICGEATTVFTAEMNVQLS